MSKSEHSIEDYLRAAAQHAEQVVGKLERENRELREWGSRMAKDKRRLMRENDGLVERVLYLEGRGTQTDQSKLVDGLLDMLEGAFPKQGVRHG